MLYNLNLYSAMCQLHLNKTGRKNLKKNSVPSSLKKVPCKQVLTSIHSHGFYVSKHFSVIVLML